MYCASNGWNCEDILGWYDLVKMWILFRVDGLYCYVKKSPLGEYRSVRCDIVINTCSLNKISVNLSQSFID